MKIYIPKLFSADGLCVILSKDESTGATVITGQAFSLAHGYSRGAAKGYVDDSRHKFPEHMHGIGRHLLITDGVTPFYASRETFHITVDGWYELTKHMRGKEITRFSEYQRMIENNRKIMEDIKFSEVPNGDASKIAVIDEMVRIYRGRNEISNKKTKAAVPLTTTNTEVITQVSSPPIVISKVSNMNDRLKTLLDLAEFHEMLESRNISKELKSELSNIAKHELGVHPSKEHTADMLTASKGTVIERPVFITPEFPLGVAEICNLIGVNLPKELRNKAGKRVAEKFRVKYSLKREPTKVMVKQENGPPQEHNHYYPEDYDVVKEGSLEVINDHKAAISVSVS